MTLTTLFRLSVWDAQGRQYLPVEGYDGQIEVYAPSEEAIELWWSLRRIEIRTHEILGDPSWNK